MRKREIERERDGEREREREKAVARVVRTEKCERENSAAGIKSNLCLA